MDVIPWLAPPPMRSSPKEKGACFPFFVFCCIARVANCIPSRVDLQVGGNHVKELARDCRCQRGFDFAVAAPEVRRPLQQNRTCVGTDDHAQAPSRDPRQLADRHAMGCNSQRARCSKNEKWETRPFSFGDDCVGGGASHGRHPPFRRLILEDDRIVENENFDLVLR